MMKKLFVVDTDKDFQKQVESLCPSDQVDFQSFSSSMEIFSLIGKEKPYLIVINLEVPDVNDFVMYDLLKKTADNSIPVVVTYSKQSEKDLQQYKKMKFQPKDYLQKPTSNDDINRILQKYMELDIEEDVDVDEFSDANIDRLVRGELLELEVKDKDDTKELLDTKDDITGEELLDLKDELQKVEIPITEDKKITRADTELKNQLNALERQNERLRSENKDLAKTIEELKANIDKYNSDSQELQIKLQEASEELEKRTTDWKEQSADSEAMVVQLEQSTAQLEEQISQLQVDSQQIQKKYEEEKDGFIQRIDTIKNYSQKLENENTDLMEKLKAVEKDNSHLLSQVKGLTDQLTDKERELVARNHEFEKSLKDKSEEMIQEAEERLMTEFKRKEENLNQELVQLKEEKEENETSLQNELDNIKQLHSQLHDDNDELKKREESLNRTVSTLAEEKVTLSENVTALEEALSNQKEACEEKEKTHLEALESMNKEMEKVLHSLQFYKTRVNELGTVLQQALALTQTENRE